MTSRKCARHCADCSRPEAIGSKSTSAGRIFWLRSVHSEREVMAHVVAGELNKQVAYALGIGEHTIKVHRSRVMEKMGVESLADLVRVAERLGLGNK